ncbi:MAG: TonB family protein [candidate division WOR-3 bacterium]|jgi:protein TonB|nr:TonB family protein [candidate division WOR-3 bacterium]MCR4423379.1 TonB family protein [candidate division WOR-3 bacterium]MDH7518718.1 TonB family protein [bacterium]
MNDVARNIGALDFEERYYAIAIRVALIAALVIAIGAFVLLPKEFVVKPYQLRRSVEMVMENLPPQLEKIAEPPKVAKPSVPVAAASEAEVQATTVEATTFTEVTKKTEETDIPVVAFWKVEVKPNPVDIPKPVYPDLARNAGIEGQCVVEALVDVDGSIIEARIIKSSGNQSLDAAAVEAAYKAKFTPAKQRDKAVRVWVSIPYRFTLQ